MISPTRILVVCKGNICRSALTAAILQQEIMNVSLASSLVIRSAGTEDYHEGRGADPSAVRVASEHRYNLSNHVARRVTAEDIKWADFIIVMEESNAERLRELFGNLLPPSKIHLLMSFVEDGEREVPDPYKGTYDAFEKTFSMIHLGCKHFLRYIASDREHAEMQDSQ